MHAPSFAQEAVSVVQSAHSISVRPPVCFADESGCQNASSTAESRACRPFCQQDACLPDRGDGWQHRDARSSRDSPAWMSRSTSAIRPARSVFLEDRRLRPSIWTISRPGWSRGGSELLGQRALRTWCRIGSSSEPECILGEDGAIEDAQGDRSEDSAPIDPTPTPFTIRR